jgi:hypothetical protein
MRQRRLVVYDNRGTDQSETREHRGHLERELAETHRARRSAEQHAFSESRLRVELQEQLAELEQEREHAVEALEELAAATAREQQLEAEVEALRRRADEADHLAAARATAYARAEARLAEMSAERAANAQLGGVLEELRSQLSNLAELAERQRAGRVAAEARVKTLEKQLSAHVRRGDTLELRLNEHIERSERAYAMLEQLRLALPVATVEATATDVAPAAESAPITPERFAEVLTGVWPNAGGGLGARAADPPTPVVATRAGGKRAPAIAIVPAAPEQPKTPPPVRIVPDTTAGRAVTARPWLMPTFERLLRYDAEAAGWLVLALLPLQATVHSRDLAYDIAIDGHYRHVTVKGGRVTIETARMPRPINQVALAVDADAKGLAELVAAGPLRRRFGLGLPKVRGDKGALAAVAALFTAPLKLEALPDAGVTLRPALAMKLLAAMIGADPTNGKIFTLGYRPPDADPAAPATVALVIEGGHRPDVVMGAANPTTTIVCEPAALLKVASDPSSASFERLGARDPLNWVNRRIKLAQTG